MEWRVVPSCSAYEVSEFGDVRRALASRGTRVGRVLKAHANNKGYLTVDLYVDGAGKKRTAHTLVAEAFIGPRPNGMSVLHGDGERANNHRKNLRYGTASENGTDMVAHGNSTRGEKQWASKLTEEQAKAIRLDSRTNEQIAADYGIRGTAVSRIKSGLRWPHLASHPVTPARDTRFQGKQS